MQWPFRKTRRIKCPDGTWRELYKIDEVFPLFAKDWSARLEATVKALKELQGSLGLDLKKHIDGFFVRLSETNESMQFTLRAAYSTYLINPCENNGWLRKRIQEIIKEESTLKRMGLQINKIESLRSQGLDEQALGQAIVENLARLSKSDIEEETSSAFQKVEKNTLAWWEEYLFTWDNVPGNDSERFLRFLRDDLDIGWAENTEIRKSDDGKTIRIFKDENSAEILIDEKKEKATLKISDGRTCDLKVKKENGKLNIYKEGTQQ